jgi:Predicted extracellular nuclease
MMKAMKPLILCLLFFINSLYAADCEDEFKTIADIQGAGSESPLLNQKVSVKAVVSGVFMQTGGLDGFFIQSLQPDDNPKTSEGLFIYTGQWQPALQLGDVVWVSGEVSELHNLTQLRAISNITVCAKNQKLPKAKMVNLPFDDLNLETLENMRVEVKDAVITDVYQYLKFGEITVSSERLFSTTTLVDPEERAVTSLNISQQRDQLVIDDGRLQAYARPLNVGRNGKTAVSAQNPMRTGYTVDTVGVLNYVFGQFKIQPTQTLHISPQYNFRTQNPDLPDGDFTVATFNMENWFTDFNTGADQCGHIVGMGCRGATNEQEQYRQLQKLVAVINSLDTAVIGLQELQNNEQQSIKTLVEALNKETQSNKWDFIDAGQLGRDVIKVGLIYQPNRVQPVGHYALLNRDTLSDFEDHRNRVVLAQTFQHINSQKLITVTSLHLKSKGCRDAEGNDLAQQDGQGCYNPTRTRAARQIAAWMNQDPTGMGSELRFIVGDFNSYQKEDPIKVFEKNGYVNLAREFLGVENWTTSYRGKVGSLDYIMVNKDALKYATGVTQWHINSDEIRQFGYRLSPLAEDFKRPDSFYDKNPFSSSDHDPVLAGFQLSTKADVNSQSSK